MSIRAVRGVRDILPAETPIWQMLESETRRTFGAFGYQEVRLPLFERTELFARSIGETTDIVEKEMYTFRDRGGDSLTLRPEATASVLRLYIEHGFHTRPKPVRLYTIGPMFRYERPQAGRYRQFHQINLEALGEGAPALDAEVVRALTALFDALGLGRRLVLHVNSIGDAACRPAFRAALSSYLEAHRDALCQDCQARIDRNPLRVLDCKRAECAPIIQQAPSIQDALCGDCREHFGRVLRCLDALSIAHQVTPRLVRGLDYYVRTTFELVTDELGAQSAVAGGGRYDGLIAQLGGPPDPGIGFAIGMERVALLLAGAAGGGSAGASRPDVALIPLDEPALLRGLPLAETLRATGFQTEVAYGGRKLRAELERAHRAGAPWVVILGADELAAGVATIRTMGSGLQEAVPLDKVADRLRTLRETGSP